jgi:ParB family chromosome partitioning protein
MANELLVLQRIRVNKIRPFADQPRKYFDPVALSELLCSIVEAGQKTPISVRKLSRDPKFEYELIDGERRLKAHQQGKLPTILAYICDVKDSGDQFIQSVVSNFCREGHRPIETSYAVEKMRDYYQKENPTGGEMEIIAKIGRLVGKSSGWVYKYLALLRLCPEVRTYVDEEKIPLLVGMNLTAFRPDVQLQITEQIIKKNLNYKKALSYIRNLRTPELLGEGGRMREPHEDFWTIKRTIKRLEADTETIMDMNATQFKKVLNTRSTNDINGIIKELRDCIDKLSCIDMSLKEILSERTRSKT